jgi:hypothetical protein
MQMKRILATSVALAALTAAALTTAAVAKSRSIEAESMIGVPAALTGAQAPIRGINGGGIAWAIGAAEAGLKASGKFELEFQNLVFAAGPNVGKNTVPTMKAIVSCLDGTGAVVNVSTPNFPVTVATATDPGGDGSIETTLALPHPCLAPIVFVTSTGGNWFAVDGL